MNDKVAKDQTDYNKKTDFALKFVTGAKEDRTTIDGTKMFALEAKG